MDGLIFTVHRCEMFFSTCLFVLSVLTTHKLINNCRDGIFMLSLLYF